MHPLPNYARRVAYIETTGAQYVDTGVAPGDNLLSFDVRCVNLAETSTLRGAFGCRASSSAYTPSSYVVFLRSSHGSEARVDVANSGAAIYTAAIVGEETRFAWDADTRTLAVTVGGATDSFAAASKGACDDPFLLGSISTAGSPAAVGASMRIVSAQFWLSGVLVRSFVPCRVGSVGYLWDEVTGAFFGIAGTGAFVLGMDIAGGGGINASASRPLADGRDAPMTRFAQTIRTGGRRHEKPRPALPARQTVEERHAA